MIFLDTNICIAHMNADPRVLEPMRRHVAELRISVIVASELRYGAAKSARREDNLHKLSELLDWLHPVALDAETAEIAGDVRAEVERAGRPIATADLFIAAAALRHGATLVTHNTRHFQHVPELKLEDWLT